MSNTFAFAFAFAFAMDKMNPDAHALASLTDRELEILRWVTEGKSNWEIGVIARCAPTTVKKHLQRIYRKLGVENRLAAAMCYVRAFSPTVKAGWQSRR